MADTHIIDLDLLLEDDTPEIEIEIEIEAPVRTASRSLPGIPVVSAPPLPVAPTSIKGAVATAGGSMKDLFDFKGSKLTPLQQAYIMHYAACGIKKQAAEMSGVPYNVISRWMDNEEFVFALQCAVDISTDTLEEELVRRALAGSDKLLIEAVKARKKEYQPQSSRSINIKGEIVHSWADLAKQAAIEADYTVTDDEEEDEDAE